MSMFLYSCVLVLFFKQKTSYDMRISYWSSDVCSSDLALRRPAALCELGSAGSCRLLHLWPASRRRWRRASAGVPAGAGSIGLSECAARQPARVVALSCCPLDRHPRPYRRRSEEHTSELQSLMRISYAVFCLKKKNTHMTIYK